jgi:hypothetical protein
MLEKIDFNEVARNIIKNKLLGEAADKSNVFAVKEEFDIYDYLPKVHMDGNALRKNAKQNLDTRLLESMFTNLRGATVQETVTNFNNALGIVTDTDGFKSFSDIAQTTDPTQVFDALTILGAMRTILSFEPTAAGTMFEKMVAGLFGGFHMGGQNAFADVEVEKDEKTTELVSVKLLKENGTVAGSGVALAINVAKAGNTPVKFFVGIKSKEIDPYVIKFIEFSIDRENYFEFMGYKGREVYFINELKKKIFVKMTVTDKAGIEQNAKYSLSYWEGQNRVNLETVDQFFDEVGRFANSNAIWISGTKDEASSYEEKTKAEKDQKDTDPSARVLSPVIVQTKVASGLQTSIQHFYKAVTVEGFEKYVNDWTTELKTALQTLKTYPAEYWSEGTERYLSTYYGVTRANLAQLKSMDVLVALSNMKEMPNADEIPKSKGSGFPWAAEGNRSPSSPVRDILVGQPAGGLTGFKEIWKRMNVTGGGSFKAVLAEYLKFRDVTIPSVDQYMASMTEKEKQFYTALFGTGTNQQKLQTVKNNLLEPSPALVAMASDIPADEVMTENKKAADNTKTGHNIERPIRHILENAETYKVVREIPAIFLDKKLIGSNSDGYGQNLLDRYEPVFRQFHNVRVGLLKYYSGGLITGLSDAKSGTTNLGNEIDKAMSPQSISGQQQPQVQAESKNLLTNSKIDAILSEL